jgi:putative DNA primase/helicase
MMRATDIHARLGSSWTSVLAQLGIADSFLRPKKAGPCPACGGTDRYTYDNRTGRGDYICRHCGAGDGFQLLERVHNWSFTEARRRVMDAAGIEPAHSLAALEVPRAATQIRPLMAAPNNRIRSIARSVCAVADCADAVAYLSSRALFPLPEGCQLRAHVALDYWDASQHIGRYPGLVAEVRDIAGELVTVHVTYLDRGRKLATHEQRKLLSPLTGREGCAVRLMPATDVLGIAEGIETALSAAAMNRIPVWAALNTSLLAKFEPPPDVAKLVIFADRDEPGLLAAGRLMERLQRRICFELRVPAAPQKDFNDVLMSRNARQEC